ncbi:competence/damage-inducible protein A [Arcticibacterium luteifluviistationis]|uniref:CinA-like protein n=1 Tax=Arcticibacterium luteifluviistationis TaxID=1784714 RepID=A0A2Z4G7S6_9BACT|nr:competence/damage-inducible protein A [Arcticibacterium luteifluviistationis]AWV97224.1 competence/damage-inducible protein A [Arcticibacterium luteifluviistationis]
MKHINAEVITIGDEILYGQITDTNSQWISAELDKIGVKTIRKTSIGDDKKEILDILTEAQKRADILIFTGGLGPTKDDITKKTIAEFFNDTLEINQDALENVRELFESRGFELTEINRQQAAIPTKATYLNNAVGTAPGMWFDENGKIIISMPGVPFEMKYLMENEVLPRLRKHFKTPFIIHKIIRTIGIGESFLASKIESWEDALPPHIKLAYLPSLGQVKLRLTGFGDDKEKLKAEIEAEAEKVYPTLGQNLFSKDNEELELVLADLLLKENATLATAESCTGGYLAHTITANPGSSAYYLGSVISYSNEAKMNLLGVKKETLDAHGAVSEETVIQMAEGAKKALNSTYALATSGIAGPGGGTEEKPVGTIWLACAGPDKTVTKKILSTKTRLVNIQYGSKSALGLLRKMILKEI